MAEVRLVKGRWPNSSRARLGPLLVVFSYETPVAYLLEGEGWVVSRNSWSSATGKHINSETPADAERVPNAEFRRRLDEVLARMGVRGG